MHINFYVLFLLDFHIWKNKIQTENLSFYSLDTGTKQLVGGTIYKQFYDCHRSYKYKPKGDHQRALKSMGSNKSGKACPSRMEVTIIGNMEEPKSIKVKFWKTHIGHIQDLGRLFLDKETRTIIAGIHFD